MVRAPCCEKMGLKKGPWTPEEDRILIDYIQQNGHGNWRALPKQAGLLRCGKSCRLRWINYLRPDIKRGNFTREEEDTIIQLHEVLGNRWSAIAARLPGRTDNEIKNVWHTHLKKRLKQYQVTPQRMRRRNGNKTALKLKQEPKSEPESESQNCAETEGLENRSISPSEQCSSDVSSVTTVDDFINNMPMKIKSSSDEFLGVDENFWSEVLSTDNSSPAGDFPAIGGEVLQHQFPFSPLTSGMEQVQFPTSLELTDSMDFWYNLLTRADQEITELPKI